MSKDAQYCIICNAPLKSYQIARSITTCCRSCAMKKRYRKPEERLKTSNSMKQAFIDKPELRQKWKDAQDKRFESSNEHIKISNGLKKNYKENLQSAVQRSTSMKKVCENLAYRKHLSDKVKQAHIDNPKLRIAKSKAQIKRFKNTKEREKISKSVKEVLQTPEMHKKLSSIIKKNFELHGKEIQAKINETKRANNSFNTSKQEQQVKQLLEQTFTEVKYQHHSELYPFNCDFYVPSLDLYIELNFHWTHGGRLFDETDESCLEQLSQWQEKAKTSKFYQNAIYTWTKRDARKTKIAKTNKLNYLVFYKWTAFEQWHEKLKDKQQWEF